ncbi:hypothetical protein LJC11_04435 [Bacteroidales bacterium OttesenSCG-928-I21]|nr:hypothetical protein [Bacteroidales bacterium OttesenSCG-928-I21]
MTKYKASYKQFTVSTNQDIRKDRFSAIYFENIGEVDAVINNCIPLKVFDPARLFEEEPYVIIDNDFFVTFDGTQAGEKKILIVETFYTEIK